MSKINIGIIIFLGILLSGCIEVSKPFTGLPPGQWRGVLKLGDFEPKEEEITLETVQALNLPDVQPDELPFNFEVVYDTDSIFHLIFTNGSEKIVIDDITMAWDNRIGKDTITINFPVYETYIKGIYTENIIQGHWFIPAKGDYKIPFVARFGEGHRFSKEIDIPEPKFDGKWEVQFGVETDEPYAAIGEFIQEGKKLTGTFMTETGDYRFLEGEVVNDKMYLSCFDGSHAFVFEAKMMEDGQLTGMFKSGKHYKTLWTGKKNDNIKLADANNLTFLNEGYKRLEFEFEDLDGNLITADDERFKNKVKIFQIMGTWCPNCRDETIFLNKYLQEHPNDDIVVIGLAFEKQKTKAAAIRVLKKFKKQLNVKYDVLLGSMDKKNSEATLPMLNHIMSYPTMVIEDKNDYVRLIHTGFSGPATSEYKLFVEEFSSLINDLLAE